MFNEARVHHATKAKAERLAETLEAEFPAITLIAEFNEDQSQVIGFLTTWTDPNDEAISHDLTHTKKVPELADIQAACEDADLDMEAGVTDEPTSTSSVVDEIYRKQYREQSTTKQSCGDWLAEWLVRVLSADNKLDFHALEQIHSNNGIDLTAKWAQVSNASSNGWQGRYRMNGRQQLEKRVALTGELYDETGAQHEVPADFLATQRAKHAKWIAKQEKLAAAMDVKPDEAA